MKKVLLTAVALLWVSAANAFILNREFNANSFVHTPLAPDAPLDPNSAAIVQQLIANTPGGFSVSVGQYADPIYVVDCTVPTVQVKGVRAWDPTFEQWGGKAAVENWLHAVPLPSNFVPASGSDKTAVIYRPCTNEMWEGWVWELTGATTVDSAGQTVPEWGAAWGGHETSVTTNPGYYSDGGGSSATSLAALALIITIDEQRASLANGGTALSHPLGFATTNTANRGFVFPAQRSDGWDPNSLAKEGMIFRFPASINFDDPALGLSPYAKMIAKTIQLHGAVLSDTSGAGFTAFTAEGQGGNSYPYPAVTDVYWGVDGILGCRWSYPPYDYACWPDSGHLLAGIPWNQLQVIQPPAR